MIYELPLTARMSNIRLSEWGSVIVNEETMRKLESISNFRKKLSFYNKNIQSLSIKGMEGMIYVKNEKTNQELKLYSGSPGCRTLPDFNPEHEKIFFELRAKEVERLKNAVDKCQTYKDKLKALFETPGFDPDLPIKICRNVPYDGTGNPGMEMWLAGPVIDLSPSSEEQIREYNDFVAEEFNKLYKKGDGFTGFYSGFLFENEKETIEKSLKKSSDPERLIERRIKDIEQHFRYPESLNSKKTEHPAAKEAREKLGEHYALEEYFLAMVMGEEDNLDFNKNILTTGELLRYAFVKEVYSFYEYLRALQKNKALMEKGKKPLSQPEAENTSLSIENSIHLKQEIIAPKEQIIDSTDFKPSLDQYCPVKFRIKLAEC